MREDPAAAAVEAEGVADRFLDHLLGWRGRHRSRPVDLFDSKAVEHLGGRLSRPLLDERRRGPLVGNAAEGSLHIRMHLPPELFRVPEFFGHEVLGRLLVFRLDLELLLRLLAEWLVELRVGDQGIDCLEGDRLVVLKVLREDACRAEREHALHFVVRQLVLAFILGGVRIVAENHLVERHLLLRSLEHPLLHRVVAEQLVDGDGALLADPVHAVVRLLVPGGVPVAVEHHHRVGAGERDAESPGARREEVHVLRCLARVEELDIIRAARERGAPVQPQVRHPGQVHRVLHHVQHRGELRVDEDLAPLRDALADDAVQHHHLAGGGVDSLVCHVGVLLRIRDHVRVVADFPQLHEQVHHLLPVGGRLFGARDARELAAEAPRLPRVQDEPLVPELLHLGQRAPDRVHALLREIRLHVPLQPPEHQRLQEPVSRAHESHVHGLFVPESGGEGLVEHVGIAEHVRDHKVQQRPELVHVVLEGRARDEHLVHPPQLPRRLSDEGGVGLDALSLVEDDVPVRLRRQPPLLRDHHLVGGDDDVELLRRVHHLLPLHLPRVLAAVEDVDFEGRAEVLELPLPGWEHRERAHHDVRPARRVLVLVHRRDERHHLESLPEAHLVSQDSPRALVMLRDEPLEPFHLVRPHLPLHDAIRLSHHRFPPLPRFVGGQFCGRSAQLGGQWGVDVALGGGHEGRELLPVREDERCAQSVA
mmetsp:Transcript_5481/g.13305  ORF Transcript_5481/g.13305 Transcript_5481/m.13305 type:complete len:706 (-) Transcript_5481:152-2269(-)